MIFLRKIVNLCLFFFTILKPVRIAILDMYQGHANQGMRGIKQAVEDLVFPNEWQLFDVRGKGELPDTSFDIYISSGGPGSPVAEDEVWVERWNNLMDSLWAHNSKFPHKKHVFLICHSFQMLMHHWKLAPVVKRHSPAFGIFPIHKTAYALSDPLMSGLPDPFYAVDSRHWQVLHPYPEVIQRTGIRLLCLEKERPHVPYERAAMGIRFSDEFVGFQFHPEADVFGMKLHFQRNDRKKHLIEKYGEEKYHEMIRCLHDKNKITLTQQSLLPGFLRQAVLALRGVSLPAGVM